jgi:tetratricopeptide (TPR) repeat protein
MALSWQMMATGAFGKGGRSVGRDGEIWRTDPSTLRDVVLDRAAMSARLGEYPSLERVWALSLLDRGQQAVTEGRALLAGSTDRFRALLVLAHAYQRQYRWHEAARLQEEALRLARSPAGEALVRYEIGRRFFDEALYRDAAAELEWAYDLYRTAGRERLARVCLQALERAREVLATTGAAGPGARRL